MESEQKNGNNNEDTPTPFRSKLINTAVEFLVSPSVQNAPMNMKISFLKKKGLTENEVDMALKLAEEKLSTNKTTKELIEFQHPPQIYQRPSRWANIRDLANSVVLLTGFVYGAYWVYQKFIFPFLFGKHYKKSIDNKLEDIDKTLATCVGDINSNLIKLRENMDEFDLKTGHVNKQIEELKSEVTSLKKLLLNRKQFPTTNISIPSWQIPEILPDEGSIPPNDPCCQSNTEEEGSGTNGSGTNGSDSSLEMIKE